MRTSDPPQAECGPVRPTAAHETGRGGVVALCGRRQAGGGGGAPHRWAALGRPAASRTLTPPCRNDPGRGRAALEAGRARGPQTAPRSKTANSQIAADTYMGKGSVTAMDLAYTGDFARLQTTGIVLQRQEDGSYDVEAPGWPQVNVDLEERDGRVIITTLRISAADGVTADAVRSVSVPLIEASVTMLGRPAATSRAQRKRLVQRPTRRPYTDEFFEGVAAVYAELLAERVPPAPTIADLAGVPVPTVHGWFREARRRGVMPAARKRGRAG